MGFKPMTLQCQCSDLPTDLSSQLGTGHISNVYPQFKYNKMFHFFHIYLHVCGLLQTYRQIILSLSTIIAARENGRFTDTEYN